MTKYDDRQWREMTGGYRTAFDPRPLLAKLEASDDTKAVWHELWDNLHHQGDVGEASYASVPHLVRIYRKRGVVDWNTYAIVAVIELARDNEENPAIPEWLIDDYYRAIRELAEVGAGEILRTNDAEDVRAILSVLAIAANSRTHARFLLEYSGDELLEIERLAESQS